MSDPSDTARQVRNGMILLVLSAACYSTAGLFTRLIDTSVWTMLCLRGLVAGLFILAVMLAREGRAGLAQFSVFRSPPALVAIAASVLAMIFNLNAYLNTSVANVVLIYATAPFVAAAFSWLLLREPAAPATLWASLVALAGVVVIVGGSLSGGGLLGDLYAMAMTVFMALMIVAVRWGKAHSMVAMACVSAFASFLITLPFADFGQVDGRALALLAAFGITQLGLGILFLTLGARHLNSGQAALISTLDVPLAPLWVWIAFADVPPLTTALGGLVVMAAVVFSILQGQRRPAPAPAPEASS